MGADFHKTSTLAWGHFAFHLFAFSFGLPLLFFPCCIAAFQSQQIHHQHRVSFCLSHSMFVSLHWVAGTCLPRSFSGLCPPNACTASQFLHISLRCKQQYSPKWSWKLNKKHEQKPTWQKNPTNPVPPSPPKTTPKKPQTNKTTPHVLGEEYELL